MALMEDGSLARAGRLRFGIFEREAALRAGLAAAVIALLISRVLLAATANLAEDEAYYWLWSTHLAGGYYDHPPMIAYWIRAGTAIFGKTEFGVRFAALLSAVAGSYLLYRTSLALFRDRNAALLCVIWMNATLLCNASAIVATPDTPLGFFTALTLFCLAKLIETGRGAWWYAIGAGLGLAFVSKYTAALLIPCLFVWMIATAQGRRWFARPEPYLGAAIAVLIVTPVVSWNYAHDWVSFAKQAEHGIKDRPADAFLSVLELLSSQAGLATPLIFIFCVFGSAYAFVRGVRFGNARWLLLGAMSAPILLFFFVHAASQKIQPNWPGLLYPAAILAAVHGFLAVSGEKRVPKWVRASFSLAPWVAVAFTAAAFAQLSLGALPIDAKKDPTARLKGWAKLGGEIERLQREHGAQIVLTDRYAITGELAFYGLDPERVVQVNERIRYASFPSPDEAKLEHAPALLVLRQGSDAAPVSRFFGNSSLIATLTRDDGFRPHDAYDVLLMTNYRGGLFGQAAGEGCGAALNRGGTCN
jgi:4-amino-4-deoxy-L-arabinose transferase-like glycosyltransferase